MYGTYDEESVKFWAFIIKVLNLRAKISVNLKREERNV